MPQGEKSRRIKPPCFVELMELRDLARLACAFERAALPIFSLQAEGEKWMATQLDLFKGRPIFYFTKVADFRHYLGYRNLSGVEEAILSDSTTNLAYIYAPVIAVKKLPSVFARGLDARKRESDAFLSIEVGDLASLAKVCAYKVLFEEPPIPLFTFPSNGRWILGAFTRIDEYEEASLFFYTTLNETPPHSFVKYSSQKAAEASFTNRIDEHGYIYIKVARLLAAHPLVKV